MKITDCFDKIVQIGIVTPDLKKSIAGMKQVFGFDPDDTKEYVYKKVWCRERVIDAPMDVAFYNVFGTQLEFIQPVGDEASIWKDFLTEGSRNGYLLHHLRFDVEDNDVANELMESVGVEKYMEGQSLVDPTARFTYYDARDQLGFIIEAVTKPKD